MRGAGGGAVVRAVGARAERGKAAVARVVVGTVAVMVVVSAWETLSWWTQGLEKRC